MNESTVLVIEDDIPVRNLIITTLTMLVATLFPKQIGDMPGGKLCTGAVL